MRKKNSFSRAPVDNGGRTENENVLFDVYERGMYYYYYYCNRPVCVEVIIAFVSNWQSRFNCRKNLRRLPRFDLDDYVIIYNAVYDRQQPLRCTLSPSLPPPLFQGHALGRSRKRDVLIRSVRNNDRTAASLINGRGRATAAFPARRHMAGGARDSPLGEMIDEIRRQRRSSAEIARGRNSNAPRGGEAIV